MNNRVLTALAVLALGVVLFWPSGTPRRLKASTKKARHYMPKKTTKVQLKSIKRRWKNLISQWSRQRSLIRIFILWRNSRLPSAGPRWPKIQVI